MFGQSSIILKTGMLYNVIACLLVALSASVTSFTFLKKSKKNKDFFPLFLFFVIVSLTWLFESTSNFLGWLGPQNISIIVLNLTRFLRASGAFLLLLFLIVKIIDNQRIKKGLIIYCFAALIISIIAGFILWGGKSSATYWGQGWQRSLVPDIIILLTFIAPIGISSLIMSAKTLKIKKERAFWLSVLSFSVIESYSLTIQSIDWKPLIVRLLYIAVIFVITSSMEEEKGEDFVKLPLKDALSSIKKKRRFPFFVKLLIVFVLLSIIPIAIFGSLMFTTFKEIIDLYIYKPLLWNLKTSRQEFLIALKNIQIQVLLLMGLTITLVLFVSSIVSRRISGELKRIGKGMKRISEGDLSFKILPSTNDEIGDLVSYFDVMAEEIKLAREKLENWNRELEKTVAERTKDLNALYSVTKAAGSTLDIGLLLEKSANFVIPIVDASLFLVFLKDEEGLLKIRAAKGMDPSKKESVVVKPKEGLAGNAYLAEEAIISENVSSDKSVKLSLFKEEGINSVACFPLKVKREKLGVLVVGTKAPHSFTERETSLLSTISDQMAVAIENATAYEKEKEAMNKLIEFDKLKTEFISMISHELRTPLTAINGFVQLFLTGKTGELNETQKNSLNIMKQRGSDLLGLIDGVLEFANIETGRFKIEKEDLEIDPIILDTVAGVKDSLEAKGKKLTVKTAAKKGRFLGDDKRIRHVLLSLIDNAAKFSPENPYIEISSKIEGKKISVSIKDKGIGIEPERLEKIFDKFYQIDSSFTRKFGGVGLGLTVSKEIIEAHGGKIWAESEGAGRGSTFTFELPLKG